MDRKSAFDQTKIAVMERPMADERTLSSDPGSDTDGEPFVDALSGSPYEAGALASFKDMEGDQDESTPIEGFANSNLTSDHEVYGTASSPFLDHGATVHDRPIMNEHIHQEGASDNSFNDGTPPDNFLGTDPHGVPDANPLHYANQPADSVAEPCLNRANNIDVDVTTSQTGPVNASSDSSAANFATLGLEPASEPSPEPTSKSAQKPVPEPIPAGSTADRNASFEPPTAALKRGTEDRIRFAIKDDNNLEVQFSARPHRRLRPALDMYCQRSGRASETVRFILAGSEIRVDPQSTPQSLGMEDGDEIRAHQESVGGGDSI